MDTKYLANRYKFHIPDSVFDLSNSVPRFEVLLLYDADKFPYMSFSISSLLIENIIMHIL